MNTWISFLNKQTALIITLIIVTSAILIMIIVYEIDRVLAVKMSPMLLPSCIGVANLYTSQHIIKISSRKDAIDQESKTNLAVEIAEIKSKEKEIQKELLEIYKRIIVIENKLS